MVVKRRDNRCIKESLRWYTKKNSSIIEVYLLCHSNTHEIFNKGTLGTRFSLVLSHNIHFFEILLHISRNIVHLYLRCSSVRFWSFSLIVLYAFLFIFIFFSEMWVKLKYYLVNQWSVEIALVNISFSRC